MLCKVICKSVCELKLVIANLVSFCWISEDRICNLKIQIVIHTISMKLTKENNFLKSDLQKK